MIVLGALAALFFGFTKASSMVPKARPLHQVDKSDETTVSVSVDKLDNSGDPAGPNVGSPPIKQPDIPNPIPNDNGVPTVPIEPGPIGDLTNVSVPGPWPDGIGGFGNGPGGGPYEIGALDAAPRAIVQVAPVYPLEAKTTGLTGQVVVEFMVDESGRVHHARVVSASDAIFTEPTLRAVEHWRFSPGTRHVVPVRFRMSVPIAFSLN